MLKQNRAKTIFEVHRGREMHPGLVREAGVIIL